MPTDILAIVSKAVFEKDARVNGKTVAPGDVWPVDRYNSTNKALDRLKDGGRLFLVTVRPPNEELWFLGIVDSPEHDGTSWVAHAPNALPTTNISSLRRVLVFESGKGMSQDKGTLGMSLQTPRPMTGPDADAILAVVGGKTVAGPQVGFNQTVASPMKVIPKRIIGGKYEIIRQIGQGGMGAVYEARHTGTGRRVAVKEIIGDEMRKDLQLVERLEREARATGAIETQHIALMLDSGRDASTKHPYLVMELLKGEDLQQLMVRQGPLPQDAALRVAAQACLGLARAHEAGVVHRDIKPANLFLARRDEEEVVVKLLDFGIARVREELTDQSRRTLTSTGLMLGTPLYMSPEQVQGPKHVDHRSDIWSLGVVLYEMLTGATPHHDVETLGGLLVAICSKPARPVTEVAPHVRRSIGTIVKRALAIDPAERYGSAEEVLLELRKELPNGFGLEDSMLGMRPASIQTESPAASAFELASTSPATPAVAGAKQKNGTKRSATPIPGIAARPAGARDLRESSIDSADPADEKDTD